jgi:hypothetical protein
VASTKGNLTVGNIEQAAIAGSIPSKFSQLRCCGNPSWIGQRHLWQPGALQHSSCVPFCDNSKMSQNQMVIC